MQLQNNINLQPYNTFHIPAVARFFAPVRQVDDLDELLTMKEEMEWDKLMVMGGGSNILLTQDVDGLVIKNELMGINVVHEDADHIYVKAGAGENWHQFVLYCVGRNYAGVENLSLIPGNIGASPMQNIGAYGVEVKDVFHELEAYHIQERKIHTFSLNDCEFGYRESIFKGRFKNQYIITSVTFRLDKTPVYHTSYGAISQELERMGVQELSIKAISDAVINIRSSKLPNPEVIGNAGSFFKNPVIENKHYEKIKAAYPNVAAYPAGNEHTKLAAGWLIEQCGWKGYREGDAGCYPKQALVLVNYGHARGEDILELSEKIIRSVRKKFGVALEREVNAI